MNSSQTRALQLSQQVGPPFLTTLCRWRALVPLLCVLAGAAQAQSVTGSGDLQRFTPSGVPYTGFAAASGELLAPGDAVIGVHLNYARDPLVYLVNGQQEAATVQNNLTAQLHWAMGLHERFELGLALPVVLFQNGDDPRVPNLDAQAVGDLRIRPRIQILRQFESGIGLTISPTITIPVSKRNAFASEGVVRFLPEIGVSRRGELWSFSGDALFRWRSENTPAPAATLGSELELLLSVGRVLTQDLELIGELDGGISFATFSDGAKGNPLEALFGVRYRQGPRWTYELIGGAGILAAPGVPEYRIVLGVMYGTARPPPLGTCILQDQLNGPQTRELTGLDADGDGIDDACDLCPRVAGVAPTGCPAPPPPAPCPEPICPVCAPPPPPPVKIVAPPPMPKLEATKKRQMIATPIEFEFDSDVIKPESLPIIEQLVADFRTMPELMTCRVQGHTDRKGKRTYNKDLSERRAAAVVREMVRLGIAPDRLTSKGYGFDRPVAPNDTDENRQKNRRVEFVFEMSASAHPTSKE